MVATLEGLLFGSLFWLALLYGICRFCYDEYREKRGIFKPKPSIEQLAKEQRKKEDRLARYIRLGRITEKQAVEVRKSW